MKVIGKTIAALLLLSTLISGCSVKEDERETVSSDVSETQETTVATATSTEPMAPLPEPVAVRMSEGLPETEAGNELVIPTDAYAAVIDSIINYIDNYDPADPDLTYIGKGEFSGIEEAILGGDPYNDIGYAYVDVNWDNIAELAILDMTDGYGFMVLELYSYNSNYGIHPILHGYSNDRVYLSTWGYIVRSFIDEDTMSVRSYAFTDDRHGTMFIEAYYTVRAEDGVHLVNTSYEDRIFSTSFDNYYVLDYGVLSEYEIYEELEYYESYTYTDCPCHYGTITPLSEY